MQKNKRISFYLTQREFEMLEALQSYVGENRSQLITAMITQEYFKFKEFLPNNKEEQINDAK